MSNPYAVKSMDSLIHHANVCLEQAFAYMQLEGTSNGAANNLIQEAIKYELNEYSQRVDNILFHL